MEKLKDYWENAMDDEAYMKLIHTITGKQAEKDLPKPKPGEIIYFSIPTWTKDDNAASHTLSSLGVRSISLQIENFCNYIKKSTSKIEFNRNYSAKRTIKFSDFAFPMDELIVRTSNDISYVMDDSSYGMVILFEHEVKQEDEFVPSGPVTSNQPKFRHSGLIIKSGDEFQVKSLTCYVKDEFFEVLADYYEQNPFISKSFPETQKVIQKEMKKRNIQAAETEDLQDSI